MWPNRFPFGNPNFPMGANPFQMQAAMNQMRFGVPQPQFNLQQQYQGSPFGAQVPPLPPGPPPPSGQGSGQNKPSMDLSDIPPPPSVPTAGSTDQVKPPEPPNSAPQPPPGPPPESSSGHGGDHSSPNYGNPIREDFSTPRFGHQIRPNSPNQGYHGYQRPPFGAQGPRHQFQGNRGPRPPFGGQRGSPQEGLHGGSREGRQGGQRDGRQGDPYGGPHGGSYEGPHGDPHGGPRFPGGPRGGPQGHGMRGQRPPFSGPRGQRPQFDGGQQQQNSRTKNDWLCPQCNGNNFAHRTSCFKCRASKPQNDTGPNAPCGGPNDGNPNLERGANDWDCSRCGVSNFARRTSCFKCKAPQSNSVGSSAPQSLPEMSSWHCANCSAPNGDTIKFCIQCRSPRDAAPASSSSRWSSDPKQSSNSAESTGSHSGPQGSNDQLKQFEQMFSNWEKQFESWKVQNANNPDQEYVSRYIANMEGMRANLLDRRKKLQEKVELQNQQQQQEHPAPARFPVSDSISDIVKAAIENSKFSAEMSRHRTKEPEVVDIIDDEEEEADDDVAFLSSGPSTSKGIPGLGDGQDPEIEAIAKPQVLTKEDRERISKVLVDPEDEDDDEEEEQVPAKKPRPSKTEEGKGIAKNDGSSSSNYQSEDNDRRQAQSQLGIWPQFQNHSNHEMHSGVKNDAETFQATGPQFQGQRSGPQMWQGHSQDQQNWPGPNYNKNRPPWQDQANDRPWMRQPQSQIRPQMVRPNMEPSWNNNPNRQTRPGWQGQQRPDWKNPPNQRWPLRPQWQPQNAQSSNESSKAWKERDALFMNPDDVEEDLFVRRDVAEPVSWNPSAKVVDYGHGKPSAGGSSSIDHHKREEFDYQSANFARNQPDERSIPKHSSGRSSDRPARNYHDDRNQFHRDDRNHERNFDRSHERNQARDQERFSRHSFHNQTNDYRGHGRNFDDHKSQDLHRNQSIPISHQKDFPSKTPVEPQPLGETIQVDDLINPPGRYMRPPKIVMIFRGLPGSGKSFVAKSIKNLEASLGTEAPRILALDDYFECDGEYEYEPKLEESYRVSLIKSFKKQIDDGYFSFIMVDCINNLTKHYEEMWSYAKQKGFEVYIGDMECDVSLAVTRNIHGWKEEALSKLAKNWDPTPVHYNKLDLRGFLQDKEITQVEMEDAEPEDKEQDQVANEEDDDEDQDSNSGPFKLSKWEVMDKENKMAQLDGVSEKAIKRLAEHHSINDWLELSDDSSNPSNRRNGKKRVRWADLEERNAQMKMRDIGFVVGHTNWDRMMDPSEGSSALTRTKIIPNRYQSQ